MNYFAHALPYLSDPYFLAGTAVPDWLSVVDRSVRVRKRLIDRYLQSFPNAKPVEDDPEHHFQAIARGAKQHLEDDDWFHRLPGFIEISSQLGRDFRSALGPDDGFRAGFLGHIVTEMLLDRTLIQQVPEQLERYYQILAGLNFDCIERGVNKVATNPTDRLAPLLPRFLKERFLQDYLDLDKMLFRLNQVMRRVKLPMLPDYIVDVLESSSQLIEQRHTELLPASVLKVIQKKKDVSQ